MLGKHSRLVLAGILILAGFGPAFAGRDQTPVNKQAQVLKEFQDRVKEYAELHREAAKKVPRLKDKATPEEIQRHQEALAAVLGAARKEARQGDIFFPQIQKFIQQVVASETKGRAGSSARAAIKEGNPRVEGGGPVKLAVNAKYPDSAPLSLVPPELLLKLPELPPEVDYRFVGRHLILRDATANIIVDYILNLVPVT